MIGMLLLPLVRLSRLVIKLVAAHTEEIGAGALIVTKSSNSCTKFGV